MSGSAKRFRFTQKAIEQLPPNPATAKSTEAEYSDDQITGLKCLVGKGEGRKKFMLRYSWFGRKRSIALGHFPEVDVNTVRNLAMEYRRLIAQGIDPKQQREEKRKELTVVEYFDQHYLPAAKRHKRSWDKDLQRFRQHIQPMIGNLLLGEVTPEHGSQLQAKLFTSHSPATNNRVLTLIKTLLNQAVRGGFIEANPIRYIKLLREDNERKRFLEKDEIRRLFLAAEVDDNHYAGQFVKLLLLTGLRRDELRLAKREHVDLSRSTLFIPLTKNGRHRVLHLNHLAVELIKALEEVPDNPYLFPGAKPGQPLINVTKPFKRMLKRAHIDDATVCLHTCRHSVAALIVSSGGTLYDVQAQLGHASSRSSLRYAHLHNTRLQQTSQRVAESVEKALGMGVEVRSGSLKLPPGP
jgi:integrase